MKTVTLSNYTPVSVHGNIYGLDSGPEETGNCEHFPSLKTADISMYTMVLQSHTLHLHNYVRNSYQVETTIKLSLRYQRAKSF